MTSRVASKGRKSGREGRRAPASRPNSGGDKRSQAAVAKLLGQVEMRLTNGMPRYAIADELKTPMSTIDRYIAEVHKRWREEAELLAPHVRDQRIARITMLSEETRKAGRYAACARFEQMLNEIHGVTAPPLVVSLQTQPAEAPLDLAELADHILDEIEKAADARLAKRAPAGLIGDTSVVEARKP
jgi:hypothetical protein